MSGKGNCFDNAAVETFFKSLKAEWLWRQNWPTRRQATAAIFQYINGFYNPRRRHSYLGGIRAGRVVWDDGDLRAILGTSYYIERPALPRC